MLHTQGKNKMWSKLDLVDGLHQIPIKMEHRPISCMSNPRGTMQWNGLVLGMNNASARFQRMMAWVLRNIPNAHIVEIIVGSALLDYCETNYQVWPNGRKGHSPPSLLELGRDVGAILNQI